MTPRWRIRACIQLPPPLPACTRHKQIDRRLHTRTLVLHVHTNLPTTLQNSIGRWAAKDRFAQLNADRGNRYDSGSGHPQNISRPGSAANGSQYGDQGQRQQAQKNSSVVIKVGMVGDAQIGKTSLMVKYVEGSWDEDYIQTLGMSLVLGICCVLRRLYGSLHNAY